MRILGGRLGGRVLHSPPAALKRHLRPMREAVRAALFSILGESIQEARFLDLFAGTGSVGIEALSRGAASCVFVDHSPEACALIEKNLKRVGADGHSPLHAEIYQLDAFRAIELFHRQKLQFDLVFVGPPYGQELADRALKHIAQHSILSAGAQVITEVFKKESLAENYGALVLADSRSYGDNRLCFYSWRALE
ncbi:16S rRNA (guanine(966)-N(2))-methyltransferase RsmD [Candidatus Acetothermia bacterium]|nr:16S rRNA (guanine(966)-N(2))-methyltransferase RsmD [Candidatus Acetothermia bacterium]MCI2435819.1 16S rRNA (guanine(966)-N(2))-methyltransferase RsmD [Candidatus Acetothermia bacterium]